ncbi:hydroxyethylthiazole kinase [Marinicrinis lubricantis]|uniref:Hydroxyethylthiazole kinase n=1 Tax=Marinicrinis lubricantis TaxID=2086470 RepID=A0ABW1IPT5_9BACL
MILQQIRKQNPLIHCITNYVVANFQANGLLAIGASPVMADGEDEVESMVQLASALSINIGTLNSNTFAAMMKAGVRAGELNIPVVLDPVGAGATDYRKETVFALLDKVKFTVVRCNIGELAAIAKEDWQQKGVDSGDGSLDVPSAAKQAARQYNCIFIVTGEQDFITDGTEERWIRGGHKQMTEVTGTGCLLSAMCAAVIALGGNHFENLSALLSCYKQIAEAAYLRASGLGAFQSAVLDELHARSQGEMF